MSILRLSTLSLTLAIAVITLGVSVNSWAAPSECSGPKDARPDSCNGDDDSGRDETFYDVVIDPMTSTGDFIDGESDDEHPWLTFGNGTSIGLNDSSLSPPGPARPGIGEFTDLSFFSSSGDLGPFKDVDEGNTDNQGIICFPEKGDEENHRDVGSFSIHQGRVQEGRGGRAQAGFWFHGSTHTEVEGEFVKVLYHLLLTGDFADSQSLPPTEDNSVVLVMTAWQLTATNEGKAVKSASCIGEGAVGVNVTVTEHVPK